MPDPIQNPEIQKNMQNVKQSSPILESASDPTGWANGLPPSQYDTKTGKYSALGTNVPTTYNAPTIAGAATTPQINLPSGQPTGTTTASAIVDKSQSIIDQQKQADKDFKEQQIQQQKDLLKTETDLTTEALKPEPISPEQTQLEKETFDDHEKARAKSEELNSINAQITDLQAQKDAEIQASGVREQGAVGITNIVQGTYSRELRDISLKYDSRINSLALTAGSKSLEIQSLRGNIEEARALVSDLVAHATQQHAEKVQQFQFFMQANKDYITGLTGVQRDSLNRQFDIAKVQYQKAVDESTLAVNTSMIYPDVGITPNDTPEQVAAKIAPKVVAKNELAFEIQKTELSQKHTDLLQKNLDLIKTNFDIEQEPLKKQQLQKQIEDINSQIKQRNAQTVLDYERANALRLTGDETGSSIATDTRVTSSAYTGTSFADLTGFTGKDKARLTKKALAQGVVPIHDTNTFTDLQNIQDSKYKLEDMLKAFTPLVPQGAFERDIGGAANKKLSEFLQLDTGFFGLKVDPKADEKGAALASLDTYRVAALDILKAISGTRGFRGGTAVIELTDKRLPTITDSLNTIKDKIGILQQLSRDREAGLLGVSNVSKNTQSEFSTIAPDGKTYTFNSQQELDNFKKSAGL